MMYVNLIWAWGHPKVYILVLPAFGVFSEVVPTFSKKPLFGYTSMVWAIIAIVFVGVYQLVRVHWLKPAPYWTREVIKYCVLFIGMVAGALAAQSERLFNIDMFTRAFGPRGRLVVRIVSALFCAWICLMYIRGGTVLLGVLADEQGEVISPATGMLALPAGAALIGLHMLLHAAIDAYYLASGRPSPDSAEGAPKL